MRVVGRDEMPDTTLLIQGPLMEDSYKFYCTFYPEIPKVFSTWEGNKKSCRWKGNATIHSKDDVLIENKPPNRIGFWDRKIELDVVSTLKGLGRVKTENVARLRGDEWYSNLDHAFEKFSHDCEKIITVPVFMKRWDAWPFRMSDHLLFGRLNDIQFMFDACLINIVKEEELFPECWPLPLQSILAMGYVMKKRKENEELKDGFKRLFGTIDLEKLKLYKVCSDDGRRVWYSNFEPYIQTIEEI